VLH
jgi:hypothetical protein